MVVKLLENDPKIVPILAPKIPQKEQIRSPKWDPLKKRPMGGHMEPKLLQNELKMVQHELKMEPKLIENVSKMV